MCVQKMLKLSFYEEILWELGGVAVMGRTMLAHRIFQFIDDNSNGEVAVGTLDLLTKMLDGQIQFTKLSFDFLEV